MQVSIPATSERIVPWVFAGSPSRGDDHVASRPPHPGPVLCSPQERQYSFSHPCMRSRLCFFCFFLFSELMGVPLANTIRQISGVQFYNTPSVHCAAYSPSQVKSPATTVYLRVPSSTSPTTAVSTLLFASVRLLSLSFLNASTLPPPPTAVSLLSIYESVSQ